MYIFCLTTLILFNWQDIVYRNIFNFSNILGLIHAKGTISIIYRTPKFMLIYSISQIILYNIKFARFFLAV